MFIDLNKRAKLILKTEKYEIKCEDSGDEFNIIKMFNKAKKLKNRWDEDLLPLLAEKASFQEVMTTLARYFKLKEEKEKQKSLK